MIEDRHTWQEKQRHCRTCHSASDREGETREQGRGTSQLHGRQSHVIAAPSPFRKTLTLPLPNVTRLTLPLLALAEPVPALPLPDLPL